MAVDEPLKGTRALVSGAARRLGRVMSLALARSGADVVLHYRSSAVEAESLAQEIRELGRRAWLLQADLANPDEASGLATRAAELAGGLDLLINNASIFPEGRLLEITPAEIDENMRVHAVAPLLLTREFAAVSGGGTVINLLDSRLTEYDATHAAYHLSKLALFNLTRMLALELAPAVRVNAVAPGSVLPPEGADATFMDRVARANPMGVHGDPADVAEAMLFLVRARFVTGQVIYVDGGRHMRGRVYG